MIIKRIEIWNYANVDHYMADLDPRFVFLDGEQAETIMTAAGILTGYPLLRRSYGKKGAGGGSRIRGELLFQGKEHDLLCEWTSRKKQFAFYEERADGSRGSADRFYEAATGCPEEQDVSHFYEKNKREYIGKIKQYEKPDHYYSCGEFEKLTNGYGNTRTFHVCAKQFLRSHDSEPAPGQRKGLAEDELEAFLEVNDFWKGFEMIRNLNYEPMPLFVEAEKPDVKLKKRIGTLDRQVIWRRSKADDRVV